jgi:hypothetical protein
MPVFSGPRSNSRLNWSGRIVQNEGVESLGERHQADSEIVCAMHERRSGGRLGPDSHCSESGASQNGGDEADASSPDVGKSKADSDQENRQDLSLTSRNSNALEEFQHGPEEKSTKQDLFDHGTRGAGEHQLADARESPEGLMGYSSNDPDRSAGGEPGQDAPAPQAPARRSPAQAHEPSISAEHAKRVDHKNPGGQKGKDQRARATDECGDLPREQQEYGQEEFRAGDDRLSKPIVEPAKHVSSVRR